MYNRKSNRSRDYKIRNQDVRGLFSYLNTLLKLNGLSGVNGMNALSHVVLVQERDDGAVMVWTVTGMHWFHFSRFRHAIWVNVHLGPIGLAGMIALNTATMVSETEPEHVAV